MALWYIARRARLKFDKALMTANDMAVLESVGELKTGTDLYGV
ncbi:hypothetical protein [uncultured Brevundimonas sp.]|nr:hypothetical protein [uncultured Brevundimonas sp.]